MTRTEDVAMTRQKRDFHAMVRNMTFFNDIFFRKVFSHEKCVRLLVETLLSEKGLEILEWKIQAHLDVPGLRSAILDLLVKDRKGRLLNVEVQRLKRDASVERATWYHSLMVVSHGPKPGEDYGMVPETYVIFITEEDPFDKGLLMYCFDSRLADGTLLGEKRHTWFINTAAWNLETPVGRLAYDFRQSEPEAMCYDDFEETAMMYKHVGSEEEKEMCQELEQLYAEGRREGKIEANEEAVRNMIADGLPVDKVASYLGMSIDELGSISQCMQE